jgi:drug/metabolite transporter (DMT)-like permease
MIFNILYILTTSLSGIILFYAGHSIEKFMMGFFSMLYGTIIFNLFSYKTIIPTYIKIWRNYKIKFFEINLYLLLVMLGVLYFPIYYSPSLQKITTMGISATIGAFAAVQLLQNKLSKYRLFFLCLTMLAYYLFSMHYYHGLNYILMIIVTIIAGFSQYKCVVLLEYFIEQKFSPVEILGMRNWLLLIVTYLIVHDLHKSVSFATMCFKVQEVSVIVSTITFILGSYLFQKAVVASGNIKTNIINGIVPMVTFAFQFILIRHMASINELIFSIIISIVIVGFGIISLRAKA